MPNSLSVAVGTEGDIVGDIGNGEIFSARLTKWRLAINKTSIDVSGFGDGGNTYVIQGKSIWGGVAQGAIVTGAVTAGTGGLGFQLLTGTSDTIYEGTFDAGGGKKLTGSFKMEKINAEVEYVSGQSVASFSFIGYGSVTEDFTPPPE
jgi:hypothetical protein